MNINTELTRMKNRMFPPTLAAAILDDCKRELKGTREEPYSAGYETSMKVLETALSAEQREILQKADGLFASSMEVLLQFYFSRGMFTSFQQYFARKSDSRDLVEEILTLSTGYRGPDGRVHQEKYREADKLLDALRDQVGSENQGHISAVCAAWETWQEPFQKKAFYFGYRYGIVLLNESGLAEHLHTMIDQVVLTEYALEVITPKLVEDGMSGKEVSSEAV